MLADVAAGSLDDVGFDAADGLREDPRLLADAVGERRDLFLRLGRGRRIHAVVYTRQSTFREESISLELQEQAAREHAHRQGYSVVGLESDPGITGRTFNRPGVAAAMSAIERGDADVIVLWKWSRLSRARLDWYVAADRAARAGGTIEAAAEPIDTSTSIGRFARGIMIELAAFESESIGDGWRAAHERRAENGRAHSARPRFGYDYDLEQKIHVVNPETGPILAQCYERYIAGEPFSALARWLSQAGIAGIQGGTFMPTALKRVLDSGFAAGLITFRGEKLPGAHETLIDEATWAAYRQARSTRRQRPRAEVSPYLLSGLVRCAHCKLVMSGTRTKRWSYYKCDRSLITKSHQEKYVRCSVVEEAVLDEIRAIAGQAEEVIRHGLANATPNTKKSA